MQDTEQKLREALQAIANIDDATSHSADADAAWDHIGQIARQALPTAEQVGERELFERTMMDKFGWERKDFKLDDFGYFDGHTDTAWMAWQARAALSAQAVPSQSDDLAAWANETGLEVIDCPNCGELARSAKPKAQAVPDGRDKVVA